MNIYDFDGTIYAGDSTVDFYRYCIKKRPQVLLYLPETLIWGLGFICKLVKKTTFKEHFYHFLKAIDTDKMVISFWRSHIDNIYPWYYEKHKDDDIVISASPYFLLRPICDKLKIKTLIASKVDPKDGRYDGLNCHGEEKVKRLYSEVGKVHIDNFYSDSHSDTPLAKLADKAFLVEKNGEIKDWRFK